MLNSKPMTEPKFLKHIMHHMVNVKLWYPIVLVSADNTAHFSSDGIN